MVVLHDQRELWKMEGKVLDMWYGKLETAPGRKYAVRKSSPDIFFLSCLPVSPTR